MIVIRYDQTCRPDSVSDWSGRYQGSAVTSIKWVVALYNPVRFRVTHNIVVLSRGTILVKCERVLSVEE